MNRLKKLKAKNEKAKKAKSSNRIDHINCLIYQIREQITSIDHVREQLDCWSWWSVGYWVSRVVLKELKKLAASTNQLEKAWTIDSKSLNQLSWLEFLADWHHWQAVTALRWCHVECSCTALQYCPSSRACITSCDHSLSTPLPCTSAHCAQTFKM